MFQDLNYYIFLFISFSSLSYDRSKASSKASSPHSAIQRFLLQMRVSSHWKQNTNWNVQMIILCTAYSYMKTFSAHYFGTHYLIKIAFILSWYNTIIDIRSPQLMWHLNTISTFSSRHCAKFDSRAFRLQANSCKIIRTQLKISAHIQHPFKGPPRY